MKTTAYRYPNEGLVLFVTLSLVLGVIAFTALATVCASGLFILAYIVLSFYLGRSHHQDLLHRARRVTPQSAPELAVLAQNAEKRLQPGEVQFFIAPSETINAYTFGLSSPKAVVMYAGLFQVMDRDELAFILGHELGHVALGHTWLNSLVGGMAGIPSPWSAAMLMTVAFLWWNRVCEYSADRAGLLACGKPEKAVTALIKLAAGPDADTPAELQQVYRQLDAEDESLLGNLGELLGTHPMLIKRIEKLRQYAGSNQYKRLQALVMRND
jgi:Zn-dependent protease with chaperone function